jgi:hypothetical protein
MPLAILDGPTIPLGESLSDGLDCSAGNIVRITVPQEYTPANLTFQVSSDGNLYNDLFDEKGKEITVVAHPNTGIVIFEVWAHTINFIKFRSGSRTHPVEQREDCKFAVAVETEAAAGR